MASGSAACRFLCCFAVAVVLPPRVVAGLWTGGPLARAWSPMLLRELPLGAVIAGGIGVPFRALGAVVAVPVGVPVVIPFR
eukprot:7697075-Alexandrium_andersonii.AAC.1